MATQNACESANYSSNTLIRLGTEFVYNSSLAKLSASLVGGGAITGAAANYLWQAMSGGGKFPQAATLLKGASCGGVVGIALLQWIQKKMYQAAAARSSIEKENPQGAFKVLIRTPEEAEALARLLKMFYLLEKAKQEGTLPALLEQVNQTQDERTKSMSSSSQQNSTVDVSSDTKELPGSTCDAPASNQALICSRGAKTFDVKSQAIKAVNKAQSIQERQKALAVFNAIKRNRQSNAAKKVS